MICIVAAVHDGDTFTCADGTAIRIAGIEARELSGQCHVPRCALASGAEARTVLMRLIYRQTLTCNPLDSSYRRVVASCTLAGGRDLRCAMLATGAVVNWPFYAKLYRLAHCARTAVIDSRSTRQ